MRTIRHRPTLLERRPSLLAGAAALHLCLVCAFIWSDFTGGAETPVHRALRTYKNIAGIFRDYRYFAPNVASDLRAGFVLHQPDGGTAFQPFHSDNLEIGFRYRCIIASSMRSKQTRDLMAQSWAALMLSRHPESARVTVVAQSYQLPSMSAYAAGERPEWKVIYAGEFDRNPSNPTASLEPSP